MTVKEIIDKLGEYNLEAKFNIVVDGFDRPFEICFGISEGVTKTNCETVDLTVGDVGEEECVLDANVQDVDNEK